MRVLDSYGDDYRASQFTIVLEDDGSQGTDVPTPGNAENEPPEKEGLSPPQRTPVPLDPSSPAPGEGPSGRKRRRVPRVGASLTPELAPVQVEAEGWGQGVPWLGAHPAAVVTPGVNVTLRCRAPQPAWRFALFRTGVLTPLRCRDVSAELAEFFLEEVTLAQGGSYYCRYRRTDWERGVWSQSSNVLELLVTGEVPGGMGEGPRSEIKVEGGRGAEEGHEERDDGGVDGEIPEHMGTEEVQLPRPSLVALPGPVVAPGANVSLRCAGRMPGMSFALYRVGVATPLQYIDSVQPWADFPLMGASAPGTYSCYYHTPSAPYVLSQRSQPLVISSEGPGSSDYTQANLIRLGLAGLVLICLGVLVTFDWHSRSSAFGRLLPQQNWV
ncbi:osteoclast associated receptor [Cricetulus griseus]